MDESSKLVVGDAVVVVGLLSFPREPGRVEAALEDEVQVAWPSGSRVWLARRHVKPAVAADTTLSAREGRG